MSERTALLADFGGVLTTNIHDAFRAFSSQIGDDPELVLRLLSGTPDRPGCWPGTSAGVSTTRASSMASRRAWRRTASASPPRLAEADALRFQRR